MIGPANRRVSSVWIGAGVGGGVVFGPTGMHPRDLAEIAWHVPAVGVALAGMWLLLYTPTARLLVRQDAAMYLRSLPAPRWQPIVLGALAFVALQLPWLALWTIGAGWRGLGFVLVLSLPIALVARWRPRPRRAGWPRWTSSRAALRGIYVRALRRRATDALVRGIGLAVLAGLAAGLVVRNNALGGADGAVLGTCVIAVVLVPGWAGALLPLVDAHRASAWLAASLGASALARTAVLALSVTGVYVLGTLVAVAATAAFLDARTIGYLAAVALVTSVGIALVATRALVRAEHDERGAASRVVVGAIVGSALAVICLGVLDATGAGAMLLVGACALLGRKAVAP